MKNLFILSLFVLPTLAFALPSQKDSLRQVLMSTAPDSMKAKASNELADLFSDSDSMIHIYQKGMEWAKKSENRKIEAVINLNIGFEYSSKGDLEKCRMHILRGIEIYKDLEASKKLSYAYFMIGTIEINYNNYKQAEVYLQKALMAGNSAKEYGAVLGSICNNLGFIYANMGERSKSIAYKIKAIELKEAAGSKGLESSLLNLGLEYLRMGDLASAEQYMLKAYQKMKGDTSVSKANCLRAMGQMYMAKQQMELAKKSFDELHIVANQLKDSVYICYAFMEKGNLAKTQRLFDEALTHYQNAFTSKPFFQSKRAAQQLNLSFAAYHWKLAKSSNDEEKRSLPEAIKYASLALSQSQELDVLEDQYKALKLLKDVYVRLNNETNALKFTTHFLTISDSLNTLEKDNTVADMRFKYETEKQELEIELLNKDNELKAGQLIESTETSKQQRVIIIGTLIGLLLSILLIGLFVYQSKQRKLANTKLQEQNQVIASQNEEKELLLKEIHHRVKNNLQVISSLLDLQTKNIADPSALSAVSDGQNRVKAMALIHHNLYQNEDLGHIPFKAYAEQLLKQVTSIYPMSESVDSHVIGDPVLLDIDTAVPLGLILNELLSNAFKYAFHMGGGALEIVISKLENEEYQLQVKDNGPGLPENFNIDKAKSLGLRLVRRLSRQLYGTAEYHFEQGSHFSITFKDTLQRRAVE